MSRNTDPIYTPSQGEIEKTRMWQFVQKLRNSNVVPDAVRDSHALQRWSVSNVEQFWIELFREAEIVANVEPNGLAIGNVLLNGDTMQPASAAGGARWFPSVQLNFAENLLRRTDSKAAIISWNEAGRQQTLTFGELTVLVARLQSALVAAGVTKGDRVAGWMPNIPETVAMMLAASSIGAIWSSCSPDFGTQAVLDRFAQIEPKVLIAATGYRYAGKSINCVPRLEEIVGALTCVKETWIVEYENKNVNLSAIRGARALSEVVSANSGVTTPSFERLPFNHPLYILYSSGTTGLPKCIVHGAGGTLLQHWKELALHTDISNEDTLFYFTTCGWMMWNWMVSALAMGTTLVLYDGAPLAPEASILWRMAEAERVTVFGTSARYLALIEKESVHPRENYDLSSLKTVLSTGSPLAAHSYDFVYSAIKSDVRLASISGGTDIVSCFALGDPCGAVYRGELQMRGLGMAVDIFDDSGNSVTNKAGELVCTKPFPSMPVEFWNDEGGLKYHTAYFEHFEGCWRHGDWAEITSNDGIIIYGRSDATLNPGGVRIGTAELYKQVERFDEVLESVVVEREQSFAGSSDTGAGSLTGGIGGIVLFVRLREGLRLDDDLRDRIRREIRLHTSPHHVPRWVEQVDDIPRTVSGKISEIAVREVIHGRPVKNVDALANPSALALFRAILK